MKIVDQFILKTHMVLKFTLPKSIPVIFQSIENDLYIFAL